MIRSKDTLEQRVQNRHENGGHGNEMLANTGQQHIDEARPLSSRKKRQTMRTWGQANGNRVCASATLFVFNKNTPLNQLQQMCKTTTKQVTPSMMSINSSLDHLTYIQCLSLHQLPHMETTYIYLTLIKPLYNNVRMPCCGTTLRVLHN